MDGAGGAAGSGSPVDDCGRADVPREQCIVRNTEGNVCPAPTACCCPGLRAGSPDARCTLGEIPALDGAAVCVPAWKAMRSHAAWTTRGIVSYAVSSPSRVSRSG
eukprot:1477987-Prymnesium_polylepis.1